LHIFSSQTNLQQPKAVNWPVFVATLLQSKSNTVNTLERALKVRQFLRLQLMAAAPFFLFFVFWYWAHGMTTYERWNDYDNAQ